MKRCFSMIIFRVHIHFFTSQQHFNSRDVACLNEWVRWLEEEISRTSQTNNVERSFSFIICGWNITSLFDQEFPKFGQFFPCAIEEKINVNSEDNRKSDLTSHGLHWVWEDLDIQHKRGEWTFRQLFCDERLHLSSTRTWPFLKNPEPISKAVVVF